MATPQRYKKGARHHSAPPHRHSGMAQRRSNAPHRHKTVPAVERSMHAKLLKAFAPTHLAVANESSAHNVPRGSETHFKVVVVSPSFQGVTMLERHRSVNSALADELAGPVHALSIVAKTPEQWAKSGGAQRVQPSPPCMGGGTSVRTKTE